VTLELCSLRRFWPVRKYPWGTCEALSSVHSDVGALKRLLFEEGYEEVKAATEERYYSFRSQQLLNLDDPTLYDPLCHHSCSYRVPRVELCPTCRFSQQL